MKWVLSLIVLLSIAVTAAQSQGITDVRAGLHIGYNSYSMGEFKSFENGSLSQIRRIVPVKSIQNYPNTGSLGISLNYQHRDIENGIKYMFHSSGSRHHYADYSGEVRMDAVMKSHAITGESSYNNYNWPDNNWRMFVGLAVTNHFGTYEIEEYIRVDRSVNRSAADFRFTAFTVEPFVKLYREYGQHIVLFKIGYDLHIASTVYYKNDTVTFNSSKKANAEMTGLRAEIGYQIRLGRRG